MKILIAYDGTSLADDSLIELVNAGLSEDSKAVLLTVKGGWLETNSENDVTEIARRGRDKLAAIFPKWNIKVRIARGNPAAQILDVAELFSPDVLILGERRQTLADRNIFLGSVASDVLAGAIGNVRICRPASVSRTPFNLIGMDGSPAALKAVETVASRSWPAGSETRLVVVADPKIVSSVGRFTPQISNATVESRAVRQWAEALCSSPLRLLRSRGINATLHLEFGSPKDVLPMLAEKWSATAIYLGPHCSGDSFERYLLGSVSKTVAARAHCSVEVVR